jgi:hypothetical protein
MPDRACIAADLKPFRAPAGCAGRKRDVPAAKFDVADGARADKTIRH